MTYLIACDLDGTTLNHHGEITEKTKKVLQILKEKGHLIVLATGRPYSGAIAKYQELDLDTPLVTDNGGSIENPKDPSFAKQRTYIPVAMMHDIFRFSKPFIVTTFFSIDDVVYAYKYDKKLEAFFSGLTSSKVVEAEHTAFDVEPTGLVYLIEADKQEVFEGFIRDRFGHTLSTRLWGVDNGAAVYEVYLKHISKSSAIKYLLDYYDMTNEQWIALGDGINDVEMIRDAGLGVAMQNAVPELKAVAKRITDKTHDDDAVAHFLNDYFQLNAF